MKRIMITTGLTIIFMTNSLTASAFGLDTFGSLRGVLNTVMGAAETAQSKDNAQVINQKGVLSKYNIVFVQNSLFEGDDSKALDAKIAEFFSQAVSSAKSLKNNHVKMNVVNEIKVCEGSCESIDLSVYKGDIAIVKLIPRDDDSTLGKFNSIQLRHVQIQAYNASEPEKLLADMPIELKKGMITDYTDENIDSISSFIVSMVVSVK